MGELVSTETIPEDNLFADVNPVPQTREETLLTGQNLTRGTVLGKITATGKLVICDSAGTDDGRRTPYGILAKDADASGADKTILVYLSGSFNEDELTFGGTDTIETHRAALRDLNIYAKAANG